MIIRKASISDSRGIATVLVDTWRTTYIGIIPDDFLQNLSYDEREKTIFNMFKNMTDNECVYVAEVVENKIIGFCIGGKERSANPKYRGELWGIYILKQYQRKRIGSQLVQKVIQHLIKMKINTMLTWVLKDNPSCAFYEQLGGKYIDEKIIKIANNDYVEISYGWDNIVKLSAFLESEIAKK